MMNKYHCYLKYLAVASIILIVVFDFIAKDWPELFHDAQSVVDNVVVFSQSYIVGFITYILSAYYPWLQQERVRVSEQEKADEIIAHRLKILISSCMYLLYSAMDHKKEQHRIYTEPTSVEEFIELTNGTFHTDKVRRPRQG